MSKRLLVAHVNCSPYLKDGEWNICLDRDYFSFVAVDDNDSEKFSAINDLLETALDKHIIHSYYIKRASDSEPIVHSPKPEQGNGEHI